MRTVNCPFKYSYANRKGQFTVHLINSFAQQTDKDSSLLTVHYSHKKNRALALFFLISYAQRHEVAVTVGLAPRAVVRVYVPP